MADPRPLFSLPFEFCRPFPACAKTAQIRMGALNPTEFERMSKSGGRGRANPLDIGGGAQQWEIEEAAYTLFPASNPVLGTRGTGVQNRWLPGDPEGPGGLLRGGAEADWYNIDAHSENYVAPQANVAQWVPNQYDIIRRGERHLYGIDMPRYPVTSGAHGGIPGIWVGGAEDEEILGDPTDDMPSDIGAMDTGEAGYVSTDTYPANGDEEPDFVDYIYAFSERYLGPFAWLNPVYTIAKASEYAADMVG